MPAWIHNRAEHILASNQSMPKSEAFAIATQQSHAVGKSPKSYGTAQGRHVAKAKYPTPKDDKKTANPGNLDSPKMAAFASELAKIAKTGRSSEAKNQRLVGAGLIGGGLASATVGSHIINKVLRSPAVGSALPLFDKLKANAHIPIHGPEMAAGSKAEAANAMINNMRGNAAWLPPHALKEFPKGGVFIGAGGGNHPAILAHELGHAALDANRAGRVVQNRVMNIFGKFYGAVPVLPGMAASAGLGGITAHSESENVRRLGRWAPMLAAAPNLLSEGGASVSGLMQMRRAGASKRQLLKGVGQLLPAFSTYAAKPLLFTGAAHLGQASQE